MRAGRAEDWREIVALEERCFPAADRFPARTWRRLLGPACRARTAATIVIEEDGAVVAAICGLFRSGSQVARIYSVAVGPEQRGRGLARILVRALARAARVRRCTTVSLEVREHNAAARAVYEKLGFTAEEHLPEYYEDGAHGLRYRAPIGRLIR